MYTETASIPMDALLAMLNTLNRHERRWLVEQMSERVKQEEEEAKKAWQEFVSNPPIWEDDSDERLNDALARFHKDWGGDKSPVEIANELRQGAEMVREVETW